ncbi:MAG: hypothetical protein GX660_25675 [Clostridiaceae bacterium]|nr:hypothetical protein [Clostridiaceae bacterium]
MKTKFKIGKLVSTSGVDELMKKDQQFAVFVFDSLKRYVNCDWGDLCKDDKEMNKHAVKSGEERIFASYDHPSDEKLNIWIITDSSPLDRRVTTILFPSEY